jgi:hypothetical protein
LKRPFVGAGIVEARKGTLERKLARRGTQNNEKKI